jgi:predicted nucleic acid-binding protein
VRAALDTNVLAYAEGLGDEARCQRARWVLAALPVEGVVIPAQVLGELSRVLLIKAKRPAVQVRAAVLSWSDGFEVADSRLSDFQSALDLVADHQLPYWDALILSVAAARGCRLLLSEDFQNGFTWRGLTVVNPFEAEVADLLERYLVAVPPSGEGA